MLFTRLAPVRPVKTVSAMTMGRRVGEVSFGGRRPSEAGARMAAFLTRGAGDHTPPATRARGDFSLTHFCTNS